MTQYGTFVFWQAPLRLVRIHGLVQGPKTTGVIKENYGKLGSDGQSELHALLAKSFIGQVGDNEPLRAKCEAYVQ